MAWTSPRTWVTGEVPTAAIFNTHVRDNFKAIGDAWTSYTPALTGWTLGNGTLTGYYISAGKSILATKVLYTVGSTDTKSGAPVFSLPVTKVADLAGFILGQASLFDTSGSVRAYRNVIQSGTTSTVFVAADDDTRLSPTAPWTWATGDQIMLNIGPYEAV